MLGDLRSQAEARGLAGDCTFVPATGQVAEWLQAIDIFVLPSRSEALSNSLLEAMACGCCPVASRVGGNLELIRHGENGMLFEAGDVDATEQYSGNAGGAPGTARATGRQGALARPSSFRSALRRGAWRRFTRN